MNRRTDDGSCNERMSCCTRSVSLHSRLLTQQLAPPAIVCKKRPQSDADVRIEVSCVISVDLVAPHQSPRYQIRKLGQALCSVGRCCENMSGKMCCETYCGTLSTSYIYCSPRSRSALQARRRDRVAVLTIRILECDTPPFCWPCLRP